MSPAFQDSLPPLAEGWGVIRPGDRKAHYYRDGDALCGRVMFYEGPLDPDDDHSRDDCAACRQKLGREAAQMIADSRAERTPCRPGCSCAGGLGYCDHQR